MFHNIQGDLASRILVDQIVDFRSLIGKSAHYIDSTIIEEASLGRWPIVVEESLNFLRSLIPTFLIVCFTNLCEQGCEEKIVMLNIKLDSSHNVLGQKRIYFFLV
jgi:hypothetical protein